MSEELKMRTIQIQLNDDLYEYLSSSNIDIQSKVKDYLSSLASSRKFPTKSTEEAKKRVFEAVNRYENGAVKYSAFDDDYKKEMNQYIERL